MSPTQAANLMRLGRDALAAGVIPARHLVVLDYLLWRARAPGSSSCQVSLATIARNVRIRRAEVHAAIAGFERLGWLRKTRTRVRVAWRGLLASRQGTNVYRFATLATEFRRRTTIEEERIKRGGQTPMRPHVGTEAHPTRLEKALSSLGRALVLLPRGIT